MSREFFLLLVGVLFLIAGSAKEQEKSPLTLVFAVLGLAILLVDIVLVACILPPMRPFRVGG